MITNKIREMAAAYLKKQGETEPLVIGEIFNGNRDDAPVIKIIEFVLERISND